jgi:sugar lactone lactonase YvrE
VKKRRLLPRGARFEQPHDIACCIRRTVNMTNVTTRVGTIVTVAGTGSAGFAGDSGQAVSAQLYYPAGVAVDASGNIYIADTSNHRVRRVDPQGVITTVAGTGTTGFAGDGGLGAAAKLYSPAGVAVEASGNIYIADTDNHRVRRVDPQGVITTVAGTGTAGYFGDMGPGSATTLNKPKGVAVDSSGNVYIADTDNHRVRQVNSLGTITTVAGNGTAGYFGEGGPATATTLNSPAGVAVDSSGNVYITERGNHRVRQVDSLGTITTVAGNGTAGYSGDDGPSTFASLNSPTGVAIHPSGSILITDGANHRIRRIAH